MRAFRWTLVALGCLVAGHVGLAQVGRGGTRWFAPLADAQRTSWIRVDDKISSDAMAGTGFARQWTAALGREAGVAGGFGQGVTASGVTLFVPLSVVTGAGDRVYGVDNDIAFVVWERALDLEDAAGLPACAGAATAAVTRVVPLDASATANPLARPAGPPGVGYRTQLGLPGEGAPVDTVRRQAQAAAQAASPAASAPTSPAARPAAAAGAQPAAGSPAPATTAGVPAPTTTGRPAGFIPGAPRPDESNMRSTLSRPSGVVYVIARDGRLRVLGLASGKDLQKPARFLPRGARWTAPVAVDATLYAATTGGCGGTADGVWALDLDAEDKPVVSWLTGGGPVVGPVAVTSSGTLLVAVGAGVATGDGKANAIVALDPKTLAITNWFTRPDTDFVTGPSVFRQGDREVVAAATRDGRVVLLDAASLGGADHATPLATSAALAGAGASVRRDAIALWQQGGAVEAATAASSPTAAAVAPTPGARSTWILVPIDGPLAALVPRTNGPATRGAVVAVSVSESAGALSLAPVWASESLTSPATPVIVNDVVFALGAGSPRAGAAAGAGATLHAYAGASGRRLWTSGRTMTAPASAGSLWSGLGQIYVGTEDGTLHAFGFDDERHAIPPQR